jgi:hypothetical protein
MKGQLIEMGFVEGVFWFLYELDTGRLCVRKDDYLVDFVDKSDNVTTLATNATIEQITNILKALQS